MRSSERQMSRKRTAIGTHLQRMAKTVVSLAAMGETIASCKQTMANFKTQINFSGVPLAAISAQKAETNDTKTALDLMHMLCQCRVVRWAMHCPDSVLRTCPDRKIKNENVGDLFPESLNGITEAGIQAMSIMASPPACVEAAMGAACAMMGRTSTAWIESRTLLGYYMDDDTRPFLEKISAVVPSRLTLHAGLELLAALRRVNELGGVEALTAAATEAESQEKSDSDRCEHWACVKRASIAAAHVADITTGTAKIWRSETQGSTEAVLQRAMRPIAVNIRIIASKMSAQANSACCIESLECIWARDGATPPPEPAPQASEMTRTRKIPKPKVEIARSSKTSKQKRQGPGIRRAARVVVARSRAARALLTRVSKARSKSRSPARPSTSDGATRIAPKHTRHARSRSRGRSPNASRSNQMPPWSPASTRTSFERFSTYSAEPPSASATALPRGSAELRISVTSDAGGVPRLLRAKTSTGPGGASGRGRAAMERVRDRHVRSLESEAAFLRAQIRIFRARLVTVQTAMKNARRRVSGSPGRS